MMIPLCLFALVAVLSPGSGSRSVFAWGRVAIRCAGFRDGHLGL
ncbi:hypothetical protein PY310_15150 [Pseudarthrobacter sp. H3Y2-7]|nr:hypothetical protein [Pseudarthrobacter sp. H3Y2-7]